MKKALKVFLVFILIWVGITFYFITQHTVAGKEGEINQSIEFGDVKIELDKLVLFNGERKPTVFWGAEGNEWKYELASRLPQPLMGPFARLLYIYKSPYVTDNILYHTGLAGKAVFREEFNDSTEYFDYFKDHISIEVVDSVGRSYSRGNSMYHEDNSREIDFVIRGQNFPIEGLQNGVKVIIKHLESGEERELQLDFQDFKNYEYNDSFAGTTLRSFMN